MIKPVYSILFQYRNGLIVLSILLFGSVFGVFGQAVTYDALASNQGATSFGSPAIATWTHPCNGTDRVLVVSIAEDKGALGTNEITGITYNGVALTKQLQTGNGFYEAELWYLIAPATGANNVVITSNTQGMNYVGTSVSFTNAHQSAGNLIGNTNSGTGNSATTTGATASVTPTTANDMIINSFVYRGFNPTPGITGTLDPRNIAQASFNQIWGGCQTKQGSGAAIASQYDWMDQTSNDWAVSAMVLHSIADCTLPIVQASGISFDAETSTTIDLSWVRGDGDKVMVVCKAGTIPTGPTNGINYTANAVFATGDDVGSSSYVVYDGTGASVTVTGLTPSSSYYFEIWEYSTLGDCYLTNPEAGNHSTVSLVSYEEIIKIENFKIFPNPASEEFTYSFFGFENSIRIELFNTSGQLMKYETIVSLDGNYQGTLNVSDVAKGLYIVKISDGKNSSQLKLSKQ
ncbi:MAG: hypothetical protein ACJA0U_002774 [Salibacteraceae bacterium]|jgi:hypothetical protein